LALQGSACASPGQGEQPHFAPVRPNDLSTASIAAYDDGGMLLEHLSHRQTRPSSPDQPVLARPSRCAFLVGCMRSYCSASWAERAWPRAICATGRSWRSGSTSSTSSRNCVLGAKPTTATVNSPACSSPLRAQPAARLCLWCRTSFHRMCARALPPNLQPHRLVTTSCLAEPCLCTTS